MALQIPPIAFPSIPTSNVQPFTFKDGITYLERLESLARYFNKVVNPWIEENISSLTDEFQTEVNSLIATVNALINAVINSTVELQDAVMATAISDIESASRLVLDSIYANKSYENRTTELENLTNAGRLSEITVTNTIDSRAETIAVATVESAVGVDLCANAAGVVGGDWTYRLQAVIDDPTTECVWINQPIRISTVKVPVNRSIRFATQQSRNITGAEIITVIDGGEGFKLLGSAGSMANGITFTGLSFTSDGNVVGAITADQATGIVLSELTFRDVAGSAIRVTGNWYDSTVENVTIIDCGRVGYEPLVIGSSTTDCNRITFVNLRVERCTTPAVKIGNSYEIDFIGCKFHEGLAGQTAPLVEFDPAATDIKIIGGQLKVSANTPGIYLRGTRHWIDGLGIYGDLGSDSKGVYGDGSNSHIAVTAINVGQPIDMRNGHNVYVTGAFTACGAVRVGEFSTVQGCTFLNPDDTYSLASSIIDLTGQFGSAVDNVIQGFGSAVDNVVLARQRGCIIARNRATIVSGGSTPTRFAYMGGASGESTYQIAVENFLVGSIAGVVQEYTDASRIIRDNVALAS